MPKQEEIASTEVIKQVKETNNMIFCNHKTAISSHYFESGNILL